MSGAIAPLQMAKVFNFPKMPRSWQATSTRPDWPESENLSSVKLRLCSNWLGFGGEAEKKRKIEPRRKDVGHPGCSKYSPSSSAFGIRLNRGQLLPGVACLCGQHLLRTSPSEKEPKLAFPSLSGHDRGRNSRTLRCTPLRLKS